MKTKIEWCDYTINPVKGLCPVACPYCYARRMYKRFRWEETLRYYPETLSPEKMSKIPNGSKVFVGSTMELFGDWINEDWLGDIFDVVVSYPKLTFIFLTKKPTQLIKWSPFPHNCWVGVSATSNMTLAGALGGLTDVKATIKFVSMEPLLIWKPTATMQYFKSWMEEAELGWLIIGQQTPPSCKTRPNIHSITQIMTTADRVNVPIFLKNNLTEFLPFQQYFSENDNWKQVYKLRQEFPVLASNSKER